MTIYTGKTNDDLKVIQDFQLELLKDIKNLLIDIKGLYSAIDSIFLPDENGLKINKMYVLDDKLKIKYEI